jgi:PDZ domain-containing protein
MVVVVVLVVLIVAVVIIASQIRLDYYAISPGSAQAVDPLVTVPPGQSHPVHGSILLTDVLLSQVSLLSYLPDLLSSDTDIVPSSALLGPYTPPDQLVAQGYVEMAQSQAYAKAAALKQLGYSVPEQDAGALVFSVATGSPASPSLKVAQIVTAVDGTPTPTGCAFVGALAPLAPGTAVQLSVEQSTVNGNGLIQPGPTHQETITLAKRPAGAGHASVCPGVSAPQSFLGVSVETQQDFTYPFPVSVDTSQIGGPSAGLAMTLAIIDKLSNGDLTGGRKVAATGTIDQNGNVGDVGGVPQKTVAVEQAGATAFFVPPQELAAAKSKATPSLHVYAVATLSQALKDLERLGGAVPQGPGQVSAAPAPAAA